MPNPHTRIQMMSKFHSVNSDSNDTGGGSGLPVRISAGVGSVSSLTGTSGTGVAVLARAAATPDAMPMKASSAATMNHQVRDAPARRHPLDEESTLSRPEQAERDERRDLRDHENAVRRREVVDALDPDLSAHVPRHRNDDETHERDRRVAPQTPQRTGPRACLE